MFFVQLEESFVTILDVEIIIGIKMIIKKPFVFTLYHRTFDL